MRIIGGKLGGRKLPARVRADTRPTTDRVREAVASLLEARDAIRQAHVLDLFAGSGALGFELLSRGASALVAVDRDVRPIERNAEALGLSKDVTAVRADLLGARRQAIGERLRLAASPPFDVIYLDPPYAQLAALPPLVDALAPSVSCEALLLVEHRFADALPPFAGWALERSYRYGDTGIALLTAIA